MKLRKLSVYTLLLIFSSVVAFSQNSQYTLQQCKELALKNNAKIQKSQLEIDAANETKSAAYTKYFPTVSASLIGMQAADYLVKMEQKGGNLPVYDGNPVNIPKATQFAYFPSSKIEVLDNLLVGNLTVMQPIYAGGRIRKGNELASLAVDINNDKLNIEKYSVLEKTEDLYWKLVSTKQKVNTLDSYLEFLDILYKDVNSAYNAGLVDKSDVLKVSIKQNELKINKIQLQNGLDMLREALCQHIGIAFDKNFNPIDTLIDIQQPEFYFKDAENGVASRYEMNLLEKAKKAAELQTDLERGEFLPQVAVGAVLMGMNVMEKTSYNALLVGTVSIPISGWWEASHKIEEKKIQEEITSITKKETSELLSLQISQAWKSLSEAYKNIELGNIMIEEAKENFKVVESNYKSGVVALSDFLEAKATLQKSQDQLIEFKTNYKYLTTKYLQAVGNY